MIKNNLKAKESIYIKMEIYMKGISKMDYLMEKENWHANNKDMSIMGIFKMAISKDMVKLFIQIAHLMRVNSKGELNMEKEHIILLRMI